MGDRARGFARPVRAPTMRSTLDPPPGLAVPRSRGRAAAARRRDSTPETRRPNRLATQGAALPHPATARKSRRPFAKGTPRSRSDGRSRELRRRAGDLRVSLDARCDEERGRKRNENLTHRRSVLEPSGLVVIRVLANKSYAS